MLIGELAASVGLPAQTIRYYERERLIPAPERASNGYRRYDESVVTRLHFIRNAQAAGLTLSEIGSIIDLRDEGNAPCTHVSALMNAKLDAVRARIEELTALADELEGLVTRSRALDPADCTDAEICHILSASP